MLSCHDAPTSPTPVPVLLNLEGHWTGTITYDSSGNLSCPLQESVETTFGPTQSQFDVTMHSHCFGLLVLDGTVGSDFEGTGVSVVVSVNDQDIAKMSGTATNKQITLSARTRLGGGYPISLLLTR